MVVGAVSGVAEGATPKQFTVTPTAGPSGTSVTATSRDRCPPPAGTSNPVAVVAIAQPGGGSVVTVTVPVDNRGSWRATLPIPAGTSTGAKNVSATCQFSNGTTALYGAETFTVTLRSFTMTPGSGFPGTDLTVASKDACLAPSGTTNPKVTVQLTEPAGGVIAAATVPVDPKGMWTATLSVPAGTSSGSKNVSATCQFSNNTTAVYGTATFTIAKTAFTFSRLSGADRFGTAAAVASAAFPNGAATAVIALATNYPDALAGNFLAGVKTAPILLVDQTAIPKATMDALAALKVQNVSLLGGTTAIASSVEDQLKATNSTAPGGAKLNVTRIGGTSRYVTAKLVAETPGASIGVVGGKKTAIVVSGSGFADALAAGPIAYRGLFPMLLTAPQLLSPEARSALGDLAIKNVVIVGGTASISQDVRNEMTGMGITVTRLAGADRSDTAAKVAGFATGTLGFPQSAVDLARGDSYADALAGGPLAGGEAAPILLTQNPTTLGAATRSYLSANAGKITSGRIFGGTSAVSQQAQAQAEAAATR
ncbi:MAG: cell wall-binding repeat-containing protein [Acidobacteria bacterium]|nr:cell wall-binding repeat-containing protein [Acidobacteriota bacterium]